MRYTTPQFGEENPMVGRFRAGATLGDVVVTLTNLLTGADVPLDDDQAVELGNTTKGTGGSATSLYRLSTSEITTPPTSLVFLSYVMEDTATGELREGKFTLGGHPDDIAIGRYGRVVFIDTATGVGGTAYPRGTQSMPVNNLADARTIADNLGIRAYFIHTDGTPLTINTDHENWAFEGADPEDDILTIAASIAQSSFTEVTLRGALDGRISARDCIIGDLGSGTTTGVQGTFDNCSFRGSVIEVASGGTLSSTRAFSDEILGVTIDFTSVAGSKCLLGEFTGIVSFVNADGVGPANVIAVNANGAIVTTAATVTNAVFLAAGVGRLNRSDTLLAAQVVNEMLQVEHVQRVHNPNVETTLFYADAAIVGRGVPAGGVSHVRYRTKRDASTTWASPVQTKFIVYAYQTGATTADAPAAATPKDAAPVDGTFSNVTPP